MQKAIFSACVWLLALPLIVPSTLFAEEGVVPKLPVSPSFSATLVAEQEELRGQLRALDRRLQAKEKRLLEGPRGRELSRSSLPEPKLPVASLAYKKSRHSKNAEVQKASVVSRAPSSEDTSGQSMAVTSRDTTPVLVVRDDTLEKGRRHSSLEPSRFSPLLLHLERVVVLRDRYNRLLSGKGDAREVRAASSGLTLHEIERLVGAGSSPDQDKAIHRALNEIERSLERQVARIR